MVRRKRRKVLNFRSKEAYRRWLAYGHLHVPGFGRKPRPTIKIRGKTHRVRHRRRRRR